MTPAAALLTLCGAGLGLGLVITATAFLAPAAGGPSVADASPGSGQTGRLPGGHLHKRATMGTGRDRRWWARVAVSVAAAVVVGWASGWPVAAILAAAGAWWLPGVLGRDRAHEDAVAKVEGVAGWAEQLRDTLAAGSGLEQAIAATELSAPAPVRPAVAALAARLRAGERLPTALAMAGRELDDPTADLVIVALSLAARQRARHLADLLAALATAAREDAAGRLRTAVARSRVRTSVRVIVGATLGLALVLAVLNRPYLAPYTTLDGQLVLAGVGALFALSFAWLARMARPPERERLLSGDVS